MNEPAITGENRNAKGQFVPGVSGNPNGAPPGISITAAIKAKLKEIPKGEQKTYLELLINKIMHKAIVEGDQTTLKAIWNYIDGLPKESGEFIHHIGKPLLYALHNNESDTEDRLLKEAD